jgi:Ran GTPase-activating protein (RanGAP) involved in mRNA processing and transport
MSKEIQKFRTAKELIDASQNGVTEAHLLLGKLEKRDIAKKTSEVMAIADFIKTNATLEHLDISGNNIDDNDLKAVLEALKANAVLKCIKISGIKDESAIAIANILKTNTALKKINLEFSAISAFGAIAIADVLKNNTTVEELNVSNNKIGEGGTIAIAEVLEANKTLKSLVLKSNNIGVKGLERISEALRINKTLTKLDVSFNNVEDTKDVVSFLGHTSLKSLELSVKKIEDVKAIAKLLENNTNLLELSFCAIGIDATDILAALKVNSTLKSLRLLGCAIGDDGAKELKELLKTNKTLKEISFISVREGFNGVEAGTDIVSSLKDNIALTKLNIPRVGKENMTEIERLIKRNIRFNNIENLAYQANVVSGFLEAAEIVGENGCIEVPKDVRRYIGLLTDDIGVNKVELHRDATVCKSAHSTTFTDKAWTEKAVVARSGNNVGARY